MKMIHNEAEMIAYLQSLHIRQQEAQRMEAEINNEIMCTFEIHTYPLQVKTGLSFGSPVLVITLSNGVVKMHRLS